MEKIYEIQSYNYPTCGIRNYEGSELYLFPSVILPHKLINIMDTKFLNYSNSPIVSPLQKALNMELYNVHFFKPHSPSRLKPSRDRPSNPTDKEYFKSRTPLAKPLPIIKELCHSTNTFTSPIEKIPFPLMDSPICRFRITTKVIIY